MEAKRTYPRLLNLMLSIQIRPRLFGDATNRASFVPEKKLS